MYIQKLKMSFCMYKFDRFLPTFEFENMGFGHFGSKIFRIFWLLWMILVKNLVICPLSAHF
jgi:hypothetical protein